MALLYRLQPPFSSTSCKSQAVFIAILRILRASFIIFDVYSSVGSLDNGCLQGMHLSLRHVIISDMCITACGPLQPRSVKLQKSQAMNKCRVWVFLASQFWQCTCNGHFSSWVESQHNSCVHRDTHITSSWNNQWYVYPLLSRARVFSGIIEFQPPVNPSRVKTSGANIACSFDKVDALYYNSCVYGDTHITTPWNN